MALLGVCSMKKKYLIIVFIIILLIAGVFIITKPSQPARFTPGTYEMEDSNNAITPPSMTFDLENHAFLFSYDILSSYLPIGKWKFENGKIIAATDDGRFIYTFKVLDGNTISFVQKGSPQMVYIDEDAAQNPSIVDGTRFILQDR